MRIDIDQLYRIMQDITCDTLVDVTPDYSVYAKTIKISEAQLLDIIKTEKELPKPFASFEDELDFMGNKEAYMNYKKERLKKTLKAIRNRKIENI